MTDVSHAELCNRLGFDEALEDRRRLFEAAKWLVQCHDDVERQVPVRNYDEAWEGLRYAVITAAGGLA